MWSDPRGPIEECGWGRFVIAGREHSELAGNRTGFGKDIRIVDGEVAPWPERKGHRLTREMVAGVLEKEIEVLVIGCGCVGAIECGEEIKALIRAHGVRRLIVEPTPDACRLYNQLAKEGRKVALLAHATC